MKWAILIFLCAICTQLYAQQQCFKYSAGLNAGFNYTASESGPKALASSSGVTFLRPYDASYSAYFDIHYNDHIRFGLEVAADGYNYGYEGTLQSAINGSSSGDLVAEGYVYLYKAGIRIGYEQSILNRLTILGTITPSIGYYPYNQSFDDTASNNSYHHENRPPGSGKIQYIHYPAEQKEGLRFIVKGNIMFSYFIGKKKKVAFTLDGAYQQGLTSFHTDYVNIRQFDPVTLQPTQNEVYYTKVNGSGFQFHFGVRYRFGE